MTGEATNLHFFMNLTWAVPIMPLMMFLFLGMMQKKLKDKPVSWLAFTSVAISFCISLGSAFEYLLYIESPESVLAYSFQWLRYQDNLAIQAGILLDPLSLTLMVVATTVSLCVHLYSMAYMEGEKGYKRYFIYLNLFTASMLGLVTAPSIFQTFVAWELVGACSFLLIGFYYEKQSAVAACKKAFIITRFADLGFVLGLIILGYLGFSAYNKMSNELISLGLQHAAIFDYRLLNHPVFLQHLMQEGSIFLGINPLTWATLLIFMGAAGKSAMFPLHIWLPDAMEGPTPVSALIHAATMVVAGVFLVARIYPVFLAAEFSLTVVGIVGSFTCLFAAIIAITQNDIKRILAFSTLSQLGYMMLSLGVGTIHEPIGYTAAIFHLFTHAFFKALLFLGAGSVIHAVHSNDIWQMGNLKKYMPITHLTFLIATLAIAGVPPFAGFFSKDEIIAAAWMSGHYVIFATGLFVAALTAFYMFRLYFIVFTGKEKSKSVHHAHESSIKMTIPLIFLAILSITTGFFPMGELVKLTKDDPHHGLNFTLAGFSVLAGIIGIFVAWLTYGRKPTQTDPLLQVFGKTYQIVQNKFYIDECYLYVTKNVIFKCVAAPIAWFDKKIVDGSMDKTGEGIFGTGILLGKMQTGQTQTYAAWIVSGSVFVALLIYTLTHLNLL